MKPMVIIAASALILTMMIANTNAQDVAPGTVMQVQPAARGQWGSDKDIMRRRHQLEHIIQDLAADQSDYGGFKEKAMQDLNAARQDLMQAEQYAHSQGH
jgi:hypothetical protein